MHNSQKIQYHVVYCDQSSCHGLLVTMGFLMMMVEVLMTMFMQLQLQQSSKIYCHQVLVGLMSLMEHLPFFMSIDWLHNTQLVKSLNVYSMTLYEGIYITSIIYIIRETSLVLSKLVHYWSKHDYVARLQHCIMISLNLSIF